MATFKQVDPWVQQAKADLRAAKVAANEIAECHRRYWIQQSYEKAIKALALIRFKGSDEEDSALCTLLSHSPMKFLKKHADDPTSALPKGLTRKKIFGLEREVQIFVRSLAQFEFLARIDEEGPSKNPSDVSYRYPFYDQEANYVAPANIENWSEYLGGLDAAFAAVEKMIRAVDDEYRTFKRKPL